MTVVQSIQVLVQVFMSEVTSHKHGAHSKCSSQVMLATIQGEIQAEKHEP